MKINVIIEGLSKILSMFDFFPFISPLTTSNPLEIRYLTNLVGRALCCLLNELTNNSIIPSKSLISFSYGISSKNPEIMLKILWNVIEPPFLPSNKDIAIFNNPEYLDKYLI